MSWRRSQEGCSPQFDGWMAHTQLDEALRVFAALESASLVERLGDEFRSMLRAAALDLLDDVARLAPFVTAAPSWPEVPRKPPLVLPPLDDSDLVEGAVVSLGLYAKRLAVSTALLSRRKSAAADTFARLAHAAAARVNVLES